MGFFTKQSVAPGIHPGSKILLIPVSYPPAGGGVSGARAAEATKAPDMMRSMRVLVERVIRLVR
jgi:hypothetical protein